MADKTLSMPLTILFLLGQKVSFISFNSISLGLHRNVECVHPYISTDKYTDRQK